MRLIVDIDGTLFNNEQRLHLIPEDMQRCENWDAFNLAHGNDTPIKHNIDNISRLLNESVRLDFLTSRSEIARDSTQKQLNDHFNHFGRLYMRPVDCHLDPISFKRMMIEKMLYQHQPHRPVLFIDDHTGIIEMVQENFPHVMTVLVNSQCVTLKGG